VNEMTMNKEVRRSQSTSREASAGPVTRDQHGDPATRSLVLAPRPASGVRAVGRYQGSGAIRVRPPGQRGPRLHPLLLRVQELRPPQQSRLPYQEHGPGRDRDLQESRGDLKPSTSTLRVT